MDFHDGISCQRFKLEGWGLVQCLLITKKINNSIDFLRHADETRFSNFSWAILRKLGQFLGRMIPKTKLIPNVPWRFLYILA